MSYDWSKNSKLIRDAVSITDYVGKLVTLDSSGTGVCPFHDDSNPSMRTHEKRGIFKCFSCGAGGDVVKFHTMFFNVNSKDAMEHIAKEYGVPIDPFEETSGAPAIDYTFTQYNDVASDFMSFRLFSHEQILNHIKSTRNLSDDTLKAYAVGVCINNLELKNVLADRFPTAHPNSFSQLLLDNGKPVYGGRVMFPLHNKQGDHVIGFSARKVYADYKDGKVEAFSDSPLPDQEAVAKYINSPNDAVNVGGYMKGNYLYGYHIAKAFGDIIIAEGYYDVLTLYELGYKNAVAVGGTALTSSQLSSLSNKHLTLCFDFDIAGIKATLNSTKNYYYSNFNYAMFSTDSLDPITDISEYHMYKGDKELKTGNFYDYIEHVLDYYYPFYYDTSVRYELYSMISDTVDAITASSGIQNFMASDIRKMMLRKLQLMEPSLTEYLTHALELLSKESDVNGA